MIMRKQSYVGQHTLNLRRIFMGEQFTNLTQRLEGKIVLFVDDEVTMIGNYMSKLRAIQIQCELINTLDKAIEKIKNEQSKIGIVIIDLFMDIPENQELIKHLDKKYPESTLMNSGLALGRYLWTKRNSMKIPYCYLTAFPTYYIQPSDEFNNKPEEFVLNKVEILPRKFSEKLEKILEKWKSLQQ